LRRRRRPEARGQIRALDFAVHADSASIARRIGRSISTPIVALFLSVAVVVLGAATAHAQGFGYNGPSRVPREHDTDIGAGSTGDPALDYVLHCQGCHQAGGTGLPGAVPQLKDSVAMVATAPGGREYMARVPGVAQSQLDDAAVARLLNWIVAYFDSAHLPSDFRPFTAEEIAPLRRNPLVRASEARAALKIAPR
jgi:mono/diheme cytochrome c family protein